MAVQRQRVVGSIVFGASLLVWAVFHWRFCQEVLDSDSSVRNGIESHLTALLLLNLFVLSFSLVRSREALVAFVASATPLGLTALAFVATSPTLPEFLNDGGTELRLNEGSQSLTEGNGLAFIVGVDVSKSVLAARHPERVEQICKAMELLLIHGEYPRVIPLNATFRALHFSRRQQFIEQRSNQFADPSASEMAEIFCDKISEAQSDSSEEDRAYTDIISFMEEMVAKIEYELAEGVQYDHVTLVVFSDFYQDVPDVSNAAQREKMQDLLARMRRVSASGEDRTLRFESGLSRSEDPRLSIVGITLRDEKEAGLDLLPLLRTDAPHLWREIQLSEVVADRPEDERSIMLKSLISEEVNVPTERRLFLKYSPAGSASEISKVILPSGDPTVELIALRFRARPDHGALPSQLSVEFGSRDELLQGGGALLHCCSSKPEWRTYRLQGTSTGELSFRLSSRLGISQASQMELLLAAPSRHVVYVIPVMISPVAQHATRRAFHLVVLFFQLSVVIFAVYEFGRLFSPGKRFSDDDRGNV